MSAVTVHARGRGCDGETDCHSAGGLPVRRVPNRLGGRRPQGFTRRQGLARVDDWDGDVRAE